MNGKDTKVMGLYIHIPFCRIKCMYCDFVSGIPPKSDVVQKYFEALKKEILMHIEKINFSESITIYFGGGTPGLFPGQLEDILNLLSHIKAEEITVEINPSEKFNPFEFSFATRLSFGVQTFSEKYLKFLGRDHTPSDAIKCIEKSSSLYSTNVDIIFGLPEQSPYEHADDLKKAAEAGAHHISAYLLTPYEKTKLGKMVKDGKIILPENIDEFFSAQKVLQDFCFERYEVSNFSREGHECKHNMLYWDRKDFLGVGVSAWSKIGKWRFSNTENIKEYISSVLEKNKIPISHYESVNELYEEIFLGLRKVREGIDINKLSLDEDFLGEVEKKLGEFVIVCGDRIKIKEDKIHVIDAVTVELMLIAERHKNHDLNLQKFSLHQQLG